MKNRKTFFVIGLGILSVLFLFLASLYSVNYNESRLVVPMDSSEYVFRVSDLPMICAIALCCLYIFYLIFLMIRTGIRNDRRQKETRTTRRISPKFGLFGFFGFLGFLGFWTYSVDKDTYPFFFFLFFGFFGFFYEGKMSDTFMDERYQENAGRAQLASLKAAFGIMIAALIVLCYGGRIFGNPEYTLIAGTILLSAGTGLVLLLGQYLLYRYDQEELPDQEEE